MIQEVASLQAALTSGWGGMLQFQPSMRMFFYLMGWMLAPAIFTFQPVNCRAETASSWVMQAWRIDDGLPDNNVSGVLQMPDGALLIGTYGGMVRFDGLNMTPVETEPGVGRERLVRAFLTASDGALWLAVGQRRVIRRDSSGVKIFMPPRDANSYPRSLCEDVEGGVWVSYAGGELARIHDGNITMYGPEDGLPGGVWCKLALDTKEELWCMAGESLSVFRGGRFVEMARVATDPNWQAASCIYPAARGGLWVSAGLKWYHYKEDVGLVQMGMLPEDPYRVSISVLFEDRQNRLWAGLYDGAVYLINEGRVQKIGTTKHEIRALADDHEGNLWLGASEGGIWRIRPRVLDLLAKQDLLVSEAMCGLAEDAYGDIWLVGTNGFLFKQENGIWTKINSPFGWHAKVATSVVRGPNDSMWVATRDEGVFQWTREAGFQLKPFPSTPPWGIVRAMLQARNGDLWAAVNADLWRLHKDKWTMFPSELEDSYIQTLAEDAEGGIWAGTTMGELLSVEGQQLRERTPATYGDASISGLLAMPDGSLWIGGSNEGLRRFKNGKISLVGPAQGLPQSGISHMVVDDQKRLWCGSTQGIFFVPYADLTTVADGWDGQVQPTYFSESDGIPGVQSSRGYWPNTMRDSTGRLWFNMRTGTVLADPAAVMPNLEPPPVVIEELLVDEKEVPLPQNGRTVTIPPEHRSIEIRFSALSFSSPENVRLRYQLVGLDNAWNNNSQERRAMYSRLTAGDYTFRVIACNNDGVWNYIGDTLQLHVRPFLWQTAWFRLGALLLFAGIVALGARAFTKHRMRKHVAILERQTAIERERSRIARDMHDDIGASLTQIAISGKLAQLDPPDAAPGHIADITAIARQAVNSLDEIVWAVDPHNDTVPRLVDYISQHAVDFLNAAGLECELDLPADDSLSQSLPAEFRHQVFLAVKEALNNVVKHAEATQVKLLMRYGASGLQIIIEDNGKGLADAEIKVGSHGLRNMRERIQELHGVCHFENVPEGGARVLFGLPWPESAYRSSK